MLINKLIQLKIRKFLLEFNPLSVKGGHLVIRCTYFVLTAKQLNIWPNPWGSVTLFPRIQRHAVMYETEVSRHAVIRSPNYQKTMITKNECVSYITACHKTETPNSNIFLWGPPSQNWEKRTQNGPNLEFSAIFWTFCSTRQFHIIRHAVIPE